MTLLLEELLNAEGSFRRITTIIEPLFADIPIEKTEPKPEHKRHWMFATDNQKIMAHVYKPDYVLSKFEEIIKPIFQNAYGFTIKDEKLSKQLIQDTITYLLFHELFHSVYCPKSQSDLEKFDAALKNGIKKAEPRLSPRDVVNKAGNVRNAMWDYLIDTFFSHLSTNGIYDTNLRKEFKQRGTQLQNQPLEKLSDGIITTWDIVELADNKPQTQFFPITRAIYALLHCKDAKLRENVFEYFHDKVNVSDTELRQAITETFANTVKYISDSELKTIGIDRKEFLESVNALYNNIDNQQGSTAREKIVKAITEINIRPELRYKSIEGIIEPLSKYVNTEKEERRDGANTEGQEGEGDGQTQPGQEGGGAEQVLQSLINQGDEDVDGMLESIANDTSNPRTNRNTRLSNLAKDEYYKRNAKELPVRSPTISAETKEVGKIRIPVKVSERLLTPEQLHELPMDQIMQFQQETGIQCLMRLSPYQYQYDIYEWNEQPIIDFDYKKTGIILPDNIIFRVDGSGSMTSTDAFVGTQNSYDCLMHVVYGITKSVAKAAKSMNKEINVVTVSYSERGQTKVSQPVELQTFYNTPNNNAKQVLLNPQRGSTYHDIPAYQEAHKKCKPGKTVEIIVTDGDLDTDHDASMKEIRKILDTEGNVMAYFTIFNEGEFAKRMGRLQKPNLTYKPFPSFSQLQSTANDIIIQYKGR